LGGNSLLETLVFGKIAGEEAGKFAKSTPFNRKDESAYQEALRREQEHISTLFRGSGKEDPSTIREEMRNLMVEKVFLFRSKEGLEEATSAIKGLKARLRNLRPIDGHKVYNLDLIRAIELEDMLELSEVIVASALNRKESRGSHVRLDFPQRDDINFLKHTLAYKTNEGIRIEFSPVKITRYTPEERKY
jgi:succinate dehydrogenase / fumarate reductase flavoprotein subunit/NADH-dependent fumarate reductase subunit A